MLNTQVQTHDYTNLMSNLENKTGFIFFLFCIWTFILLSRPQDIFPFLIPLRPALVMGILTLGMILLNLKDLPGPPLFRERQIKYYTALVMILAIGIPFALHKGLAYHAVFPTFVYVLIFFYSFYKIISSVKRLYIVLLASSLGAGLYSFFSLINYGTGRLQYGGVLDPNDIVFFTLGFLPINLIFISRDNPILVRIACIFSFSMGIPLILLTGSRGGFIAFVIATALLMFMKTNTIKASAKYIFIVMGLILFYFLPIDSERYWSIIDWKDDYNVQLADEGGGRFGVWRFALRSMSEHPFTGVGVGGSARARFLDQEALGRRDLAYKAIHNSVLQVGVETGIVGMALFLLLCFNTIRIFNKARKESSNIFLVKSCEMGIIAFVGLFVSGFFITHGFSVYFLFYFAFSAVVNQMLAKQQISVSQNEMIQEQQSHACLKMIKSKML